ncbi:MAG: SH3 domain-containing protein [Anaerolineae bacterium]|nr:SH3 domain-containing protein [Anaerolineae bacterium]
MLVLTAAGAPPRQALAQGEDGLQPGLAIATLRLNVRAEADRNADLVTTLEPGQLVNVLEIAETWAHIEVDGVTGWSMIPGPAGSPTLVNVSGPTPAPRGYHCMTYDVESDRVILFGGEIGPPPLPPLNDTWSYEVATNTWTQMAPAQSPSPGEGPLAYDVQSDRAILFLGTIGWPPLEVPSETWAYDLNTDTWTNVEPPVVPPALLGARMVYDTESDRMILFGGIDSMEFIARGRIVYTNATWAYDFESNSWTQMAPTVSPPGMNYHAMAYDTGADRVILIGSNALEITDDTWIYDYNSDTWEVRQTAESPKHRDYSAMVYAAGIGRVILFGEGEPTVKNDTWTYDFAANTWTELSPDPSPGRQGWHAMAYSSAADRIILFGGGRTRSQFTLETWVYDPSANTWTQVGP